MVDTEEDVNFRHIVQSQYLAALEMLKRVIESCPDALWDDPSYRNRFWHMAYHALFYTHLYVQPGERDFVPWAKHRPNLNFMGPLPWPPHDVPDPGEPYSQEELLAYLDHCRDQVRQQTAALDLERSDSGFGWIPLSKLELQFYTIRHLQQHTGELCERLYVAAGKEVDWVGARPDG